MKFNGNSGGGLRKKVRVLEVWGRGASHKENSNANIPLPDNHCRLDKVVQKAELNLKCSTHMIISYIPLLLFAWRYQIYTSFSQKLGENDIMILLNITHRKCSRFITLFTLQCVLIGPILTQPSTRAVPQYWYYSINATESESYSQTTHVALWGSPELLVQGEWWRWQIFPSVSSWGLSQPIHCLLVTQLGELQCLLNAF